MKIKILLSSILVTSIFSGCSSLKQVKNENYIKNVENVEQNLKVVKHDYERKKVLNQVGPSVNYKIILEENDIPNWTKEKKVKLLSNGLDLYSFMQELSHSAGLGLVMEADKESLKKRVSLNIKNSSLANAIKSIESILDLDISIKGELMYVKDKMSLIISLPALETERTKIYSDLQNNLSSFLGSKSTVVLNKNSGTFLIEALPNKIRQSHSLIEKIVNESTSRALVRLYIYKIDNSKAREYGVTASALVDGIYSLSAGSSISGSSALSLLYQKDKFKNLTDGTQIKTDSVMTAIKMMENANILTSVSSPSIMLYNGVLASLDDMRESGDWVPGSISEYRSTTSGVVDYQYKESKPTFEKYSIGNELKLVGRIDSSQKTIHADIKYSESNVYGQESTTWKRSDNDSVVLNHKLIAKNEINTMVTLSDNVYSIISGTRQRGASVGRSGVPGTDGTVLMPIGNNTSSSDYHDVLIVAIPHFPEKTKTVIVRNF